MASAWFGGRAIDLVKARSLFVKVFPTPASLSERRAVLHALRRYGPIEIFKRLPNPETFVCAPTKSEVASELLSRSPLTFKFVSETLDTIEAKSLPGISPVGVASPIQIHEEATKMARTSPNPGAEEQQQAQQSDMVKTFTLYINPSQSYYEHKTNVRLSPIHGPWPKTLEQDQDFIYFALKEVVPDDMTRAGLCDWHTGGQLSGEPAAIRAQQEHSKLWHIRERQMRRKKDKEVEKDEDSALVAIKGLAKSDPRVAAGRADSTHPAASEYSEGERSSQQNQERTLFSDPFEEMARQAQREGSGEKPTPPSRKGPAWVRRKQIRLNPLADGKHRKVDKKAPLPDPKGAGKWFEFRSVFNSQMDNVRFPPLDRPLEGKR
ncbi:hypothetical protein VPNG_05529 [Cytospora leucostoma]|uniref:Uncharacterized protein n=1 Tax=Cytospora leucostoma TaxID=1230097 RepID=A0A423XBE4_9PEZI|nr:hypothetical protein VPNG_05529 [Cytospora leucostoma]